MVDCFRRTEDIPPLADAAIAIGASCLWLQLGVVNEEAAAQARAASLDIVQDICVKIEHASTFGIQGERAAGEKFIDACEFFSHLANIDDAKTLVIHPASTTHRQLNNEDLARAGVSSDMVRLSVGIEDVQDILWDIDQALERSCN